MRWKSKQSGWNPKPGEGAETIDAKADQYPATPSATESGLAGIIEPVRAQLEQVELTLRRELDSRDQWLSPLLSGLGKLGGKRIRPLLTLLFGQMASSSGKTSNRHVDIAAAFELVHLATLVHDDVIDQAEIRRGQLALYREHGTRDAILTGDYLFTLSFSVASRSESVACIESLARASRRVCSGEIRQNFSSGDWSLSIDEYLQIVSGKTASLCAGAAESGVMLSGGTAEVAREAWRFGDQIGIAFQIVDDCLDLVGSVDEAGKTLGTDLERGKPTFPVIHALAQGAEASSAMRQLLGCSSPSPTELALLLEQTGSLAAAREYAELCIQRAQQILRSFPDGPARTSLNELAAFVISRRW